MVDMLVLLSVLNFGINGLRLFKICLFNGWLLFVVDDDLIRIILVVFMNVLK